MLLSVSEIFSWVVISLVRLHTQTPNWEEVIVQHFNNNLDFQKVLPSTACYAQGLFILSCHPWITVVTICAGKLL